MRGGGRVRALTLWRIFEADWQKMKHRRDTYKDRVKDRDGDGRLSWQELGEGGM